jgi:hypothetical protein
VAYLPLLLPVERNPGSEAAPARPRTIATSSMASYGGFAPARRGAMCRKSTGKWNSIYRRFRPRAPVVCGRVWPIALAEAMAESGHYEVDSTTVRAHVSAAGGREESSMSSWRLTWAGSPVKFFVSVMPEGDQSPSTSRLAKQQTAKATTR